MKENEWRNDAEYMSYVGNLLVKPEVQKLSEYEQHHFCTRLDHVITVSYESYKIAQKMNLDARAVARAGLLHDLFYYDWRDTKFNLGTHAWIHPRVAVRNAEKITTLTAKEKDIIIKHMWGATLIPPKYPEGFIVTAVDKISAVDEYSRHLVDKVERMVRSAY